MKKVFFSFAIATMMASLVACGGQSGQNAEGQDSTAVEAEEAEASANVIDAGVFTIEPADGYEIKQQRETALGLAKDGVYLNFEINTKDIKNTAASIAEFLANREAFEAREDVTIGSNTWKVVFQRDDENPRNQAWNYIIDLKDHGYVKAQIPFNKDFETNPELKTMLESIKFK